MINYRYYKLFFITLLALPIMMIQGSAQASITVLESSDPSNVRARYIRLQNYPRPLPSANTYWAVNWPERDPDCPTASQTNFKTLPWLAANSAPTPTPRHSGDDIDDSGDCGGSLPNQIFQDGGTDTYAKAGVPSINPPGVYNTEQGAWLRPEALGGWAGIGSPAGFGSNAIGTQGTPVESNELTAFPASTHIWGSNNDDTQDQAPVMFKANGWATYSPDLNQCLYSNGITLFRQNFVLDQNQKDMLVNGIAKPKLRIAADDWFAAYVNGRFIGATTSTIGEINIDFSSITGLLNVSPAVNVLAIQAIDKAWWLDCGTVNNGGGRASGVAYQLILDVNDSNTPAQYRTTTSASEYEKGSSAPVFDHNIIVGKYPCDTSQPMGSPITVAWSTDQTATGGIGEPQNGTIIFYNCQYRLRVIGGDSPGLKPVNATQVTITKYTVPDVDIDILDAAAPGSSFGRLTTVGTQTSNGSVSVFEAPFARFFGNDVNVCGTGDNNRFVYDADNGVINYWRGSFAEYASIYNIGNAAPNLTPLFSGLNSSSLNGGFPNALDTNWSNLCNHMPESGDYDAGNVISVPVGGLTIKNSGAPTPPNIDVIPTDSNTRITYKVTGNVTIENNIELAEPILPLDPKAVPIVLIYATGDIRISKNVSNIDAVLIAGGDVYTCYEAISHRDRYDEDCSTPLKIYGAIKANNVYLQRAKGTRLLADLATIKTINLDPNSNGTAAEIVEYPWYMPYIRFELHTSTQKGKYDAYYSLPPRL